MYKTLPHNILGPGDDEWRQYYLHIIMINLQSEDFAPFRAQSFVLSLRL